VAGSVVVWHGNKVQQSALLQAIQRNCTCPTDDGLGRGSCPAHQALLDQRFIDGLLFARYLAERLLVDEFCLAAP